MIPDKLTAALFLLKQCNLTGGLSPTNRQDNQLNNKVEVYTATLTFCVWKMTRSEAYRDLGIDGRIILKWLLNSVLKCGLDSSGSG